MRRHSRRSDGVQEVERAGPERHAAEGAASVSEDAASEASVQDLLRRALAELGPARKETTRG